jgi:cytochrome c5
MNSARLETAILCGAIAFFLGTALPARAADPAANQGAPASFARGAQAWANNCARCHNARDPKDFRNDQWEVIMGHMRIQSGLTGQEARDVLTFLQGSNAGPTPQPVRASAGGAGAVAGTSAKALYDGTCIACHGSDGKGTLPGVPDLSEPGGRLAKPDSVLEKHILEGFQEPGSPMAMPAKGGNPSLTPQEVANLLTYMRATFKP